VEKCGGKVWLESEPGRGATFRFRLRTATAAAFSTVA
jgi:signal transduction histidine kinase